MDMVNGNGIMSEEATAACKNYYEKIRSIVTVNNKFLVTADINLCKSVVYNLSRIPEK